MTNRSISPERRLLYRAGQVVAVIGFLMFASFFVSIALAFLDDGPGFGPPASSANCAVTPFSGFMLMAGTAMMGAASKGLAGSGVVLDPEQSRRDVEPWSRAAGGMIADAIDEARQEFQLPAVGEGGIVDEGVTTATDMPFDEKLRRLHSLFEEGILTRDEYERKKCQWLDAEGRA